VADSAALRKQVKTAVERARRVAAARRARVAEAEAAWATFIANVASPAVRQLANVLRAEGKPFDVQTPASAIHLVSDRHRDDRIELELDTNGDTPAALLIVNRRHRGHVIREERPLAAGAAVDAISEDVLVADLLDALSPWLE
jgi:hypothetical protein